MTRVKKGEQMVGAAECVMDAIKSGCGLQEAFDCLVRELRKAMDFDLAAIEWVEGESAVVGAVSSRVMTDLYRGRIYPLKGTETGRVVEQRGPAVVSSGQGIFSFVRPSSSPGGIRSTVLFPLFSGGEVAGVVRLASVRRNAFDDNKVQSLRDLLGEIGGALVNLRSDKADRQKYEQLHQEQRERLLLINTLAHELKTPLTAVIASAGLLVEELQSDPKEERRKLAENIVRAAGKLEARLAELVELARSEKTGVSLDLQLLDIRPLLENAATVFRPVTTAKNQTLTLELAENVPLVMGDRQRLEQVVLNLLSNASKFNRTGGKIWLTLINEGKRLVVKVRDNGPGISAEEQERIFRPYYRVEADRQRFEGLGLGLALCKQIVTAHGGSIWVESRYGEGSTFSFSLPVADLEKTPTTTPTRVTLPLTSETLESSPTATDGPRSEN